MAKKLSKDADELHAACIADNIDKPATEDGRPHMFYQADLVKFVDRDVTELLHLVQELSNHKLFRAFKIQGRNCWCARSKELAASLSTFSEQERMVFDMVEDSGKTGAWSKKIKSLTSIPPNEVQKAITKLEKAGLVKAVKAVKSPSQRIYVLTHIIPAADITGGNFFDAGELDATLVDELCNLIIFHVRQQSWADSKRRTRRGSSFNDVADDSERRKRKRPIESIENDTDGVSKKQKHSIDVEDDHDDSNTALNGKKRKPSTVDIEDSITHKTHSRAKRYQLAYPAGTHQYPTTDSILEFVLNSNALRDGKTTSYNEVQALINILVWDDKLEPLGGGYRTVRGVEFIAPGAEDDDLDNIAGNGLTEAPCGRCKLVSLCKEGTKVSPETCVYYTAWLKT